MFKFIQTLILSFILIASVGCKNEQNIKLVVFISVDQMRGDFLNEFDGQIDHGLRELQTGHVYSNVHHHHSNTVTAAGHATLLTGTHPSTHGIVGNNVYLRNSGISAYSIADSSVQFVGVDSCSLAKVSAANLKRPTLGEIIKTKNSRSKSYSVAIKDRASILMGGKKCDMAFWFDSESMQMVSTDYYPSPFPSWVSDFNAAKVMKEDLDAGWQLEPDFEPIAGFTSSDSIIQELDRFFPPFPHNKSTFNPDKVTSQFDGDMIWNTPFGDKYVLQFAEKLITEQQLGIDDDIDILTVGLSTADVIGHHFGPNSYEILDYYNKLDQYIATFIASLDERIGKDNYIIVLSSDHGVNPMPEVHNEDGAKMRIGHGQFDTDMATVDNAVRMQFGLSKSIIKEASYKGFEPELSELASKNIDTFSFVQYVTEQLREVSYIHEAYSRYDLVDSTCTKPFLDFVRHSTVPNQAYLIQFVPEANYLVDFRDHGTTHGTPYEYDTHVPLLIYGSSIKALSDTTKHYTVDIVPTILDLLKIDSEASFDGVSLVKTKK